MSTAAGAPSNGANEGVKSPQGKDKGKGKSLVTSPDVSMEEEEDDDDDDDDEEMEEAEDDDDDEDEEEASDIDPSAIIGSGRRTRGAKVDYSSKEAHEKAGLEPDVEEEDDDDDDDDDEMK